MRMPVPPSCGTLGKVLRRSSSATTENYTQERAGGERPRLRKVPCWASGAGLSPATHFRSRCLFSVPGNRALFPAARHNGNMAAAELREALELRLDQLAIRTEVVEHPEVFTVEEMMPHIQHLKGAHSKNLFLKDKRKKSYWLVTILHDRQINLNDLAKQLGIGSGNLRFADETAMLEKLKVGQGCATPLALFCDDGDVRFVLDSAFLEGGHEKVYFHPMTNAATMGLSPEDFLTFVKKTGHDPIILNFDGNNKLG
nr:prolyl-tRNA synthetase associated domain-containing protein 1 [Manis javanica]